MEDQHPQLSSRPELPSVNERHWTRAKTLRLQPAVKDIQPKGPPGSEKGLRKAAIQDKNKDRRHK